MSSPAQQSASPEPRRIPDPLALLTFVAMIAGLGLTIRFAPDFWPSGPSVPAGTHLRPRPQIQDFAFLLNYSRGQFPDRDASPYAVDTHKRFMARWLGEKQDWSMCFGWSPAAVPLLVPLFALPTPAAWAIFCAISAALFLLAARSLSPASRHGPIILRLAAASPCAIFIIGNGQTSLLTTAALLAGLKTSEDARRTWWADAALGIGLGMLAFKPPIAILAGTALLASGRWRPALLGSAIAAAVAVATTLWFGPAWIGDYLRLLGSYDTDSCDPIFRAGFVPWIMSNSRSVLLTAGLPDGAASSISSTCFLISCAAIIIVPMASRRPMAPRMALGAAIMAYCLFAPHLSPSEDLAILIPAWIALADAPNARITTRAVMGCLLVFFAGGATAWLIPMGFVRTLAPLLGFCGKLFVAAGFVEAATFRRSGAPWPR